MINIISPDQLTKLGASTQEIQQIQGILNEFPPEAAWQKISKTILTKQHSFELHYTLFKIIFPSWPENLIAAPAWIPTTELIQTTNLFKFMSEINIPEVKAFHAWSTQHYPHFWEKIIKKCHIVFQQPYQNICLLQNPENPHWLNGAKLNIAESCFTADPQKTALIYLNEKQTITKMTYAELNKLSNRIANSLITLGYQKSDAIAIDMPMTHFAVAIYLGIIKMGGIVVSIADSFSPEEIATRLNLANTKAIFTQDFVQRDTKKLALYEKIIAANAPRAIVLPCRTELAVNLRQNDLAWQYFLSDNTEFHAVPCDPMQSCNILFSSGTTGHPKAIPWNHTTAIKAASDGFFHQNIQSDDIVSWPTNLGWMMGPWLIFASLINQASIALYTDAPQTKAFGEFIQNAKVTILGVIPSLVSHWKQSQCMNSLDWSAIKLFSSTGECSNPNDMFFLMFLAGYKPIIEYCGGTEIGGAYVTSTVCEKNYPSVFTTPAMGIDFILLDENGKLANEGEVALIPPSIGLSTEILNGNHHDIYYANMPAAQGAILRRHGDQLRQFPNKMYCTLGRIDDTMNLGGIKTSSAEIERVLSGIPGILECAAVAVTLANHGPSALVIFAVAEKQSILSLNEIKQTMQTQINQHLNPLFKIHELILVPELPKTASNKIMRQVLRNIPSPGAFSARGEG